MSLAAPAPILRATVSADGRLLRADALIAGLQSDAGGTMGGVLAVPQLAAIARLAARLEIVVSRPIVAATGTSDIDMWVRARPEGGAVEISIIDWRERPSSAATSSNDARGVDLATTGDGWSWQIDTHLRFAMVVDEDGLAGAPPSPMPQVGSRFSGYFRLEPDAEGELPILQAFTQRSAFSRQRATLVQDESASVLLSGFPLFDMAGRLSGYRGKAVRGEVEAIADDSAPLDTGHGLDFGRRLDRSLRQPLGRIIANADTISAQLEGPLRPDYAGYANDIAAAGRHLLALVDDLADLQAIDRPDFSVETEDVDVADLARRAAGLLGVKAIDRRITIDAPRAEEAVFAVGEFRRVLQILVNLIGNAVRYSPEESQIWVQVARGDVKARVIVADQGPGIAADAQDRIFEKFERLGRDEAGGSGLGLYISRQLARAMGGDITVESVPEKGARFILTLPVG
jgi:signal transduction histidine kinase